MLHTSTTLDAEHFYQLRLHTSLECFPSHCIDWTLKPTKTKNRWCIVCIFYNYFLASVRTCSFSVLIETARIRAIQLNYGFYSNLLFFAVLTSSLFLLMLFPYFNALEVFCFPTFSRQLFCPAALTLPFILILFLNFHWFISKFPGNKLVFWPQWRVTSSYSRIFKYFFGVPSF